MSVQPNSSHGQPPQTAGSHVPIQLLGRNRQLVPPVSVKENLSFNQAERQGFQLRRIGTGQNIIENNKQGFLPASSGERRSIPKPLNRQMKGAAGYTDILEQPSLVNQRGGIPKPNFSKQMDPPLQVGGNYITANNQGSVAALPVSSQVNSKRIKIDDRF